MTDFAKSQLDLSPKVRFGGARREHHHTDLALAWLQARAFVVKAKNIELTGMQAEAPQQ